jgi:predicted nucleotidyltransferase
VKLQQDLREFIELLNSLRVDYIVIGGHAVAFHGHPRFTGDIDFLVRSTRENAERLLEALRAFGFSELALSIDDFTRPNAVVQLGRPPNRIDLLTSISGVDFEEAWDSRLRGELDGIPVSFLGLEALLKNKQASGRDKDLGDIKKLRAIAAKAKRTGPG